MAGPERQSLSAVGGGEAAEYRQPGFGTGAKVEVNTSYYKPFGSGLTSAVCGKRGSCLW